MPNRTFVMLAALVMMSTRVIAGCSSGDTTYRTDPSRIGYSETHTMRVANEKSVADVAVLDTTLGQDFFEVQLYADGMSEASTLIMDLPAASGEHRLEDLHATLRVPGKTEPVAITGVLQVREVAPPCGTGACGRLDADLVPDAASVSTSRWITGQAALSYTEEIVENSSSGGGCGQQSNPWDGKYGGSR